MNQKRRAQSIALLWLLVLAILTSQWLGFAHRMSHMSTNAGEVLAIAFDDQGKFELRKLGEAEASVHSCLLTDAGSIVDAIEHATSWNFISIFLPRASESYAVFHWFSSLHLAFLSRAPPF